MSGLHKEPTKISDIGSLELSEDLTLRFLHQLKDLTVSEIANFCPHTPKQLFEIAMLINLVKLEEKGFIIESNGEKSNTKLLNLPNNPIFVGIARNILGEQYSDNIDLIVAKAECLFQSDLGVAVFTSKSSESFATGYYQKPSIRNITISQSLPELIPMLYGKNPYLKMEPIVRQLFGDLTARTVTTLIEKFPFLSITFINNVNRLDGFIKTFRASREDNSQSRQFKRIFNYTNLDSQSELDVAKYIICVIAQRTLRQSVKMLLYNAENKIDVINDSTPSKPLLLQQLSSAVINGRLCAEWISINIRLLEYEKNFFGVVRDPLSENSFRSTALELLSISFRRNSGISREVINLIDKETFSRLQEVTKATKSKEPALLRLNQWHSLIKKVLPEVIGVKYDSLNHNPTIINLPLEFRTTIVVLAAHITTLNTQQVSLCSPENMLFIRELLPSYLDEILDKIQVSLDRKKIKHDTAVTEDQLSKTESAVQRLTNGIEGSLRWVNIFITDIDDYNSDIGITWDGNFRARNNFDKVLSRDQVFATDANDLMLKVLTHKSNGDIDSEFLSLTQLLNKFRKTSSKTLLYKLIPQSDKVVDHLVPNIREKFLGVTRLACNLIEDYRKGVETEYISNNGTKITVSIAITSEYLDQLPTFVESDIYKKHQQGADFFPYNLVIDQINVKVKKAHRGDPRIRVPRTIVGLYNLLHSEVFNQ
jgi:hypothetical protein